MVKQIARTVAEALITLLISSFIIFSGIRLAPGNALASLIGRPDSLSAEKIAAIEAQYHLNDPFFVQYGAWLINALQGQFGRSYVYGQEVSGLLLSRMDTTVALLVFAYIIVMFFGLTLGIASVSRGGNVDRIITITTSALAGVPQFAAGMVLVAFFAVEFTWFPVAGDGEGIMGRMYHLVLPAISLAFVPIAIMARVTRQSMIEIAGSEHVRVARARGLPEGLIMRRHVFRNAAGPIITMAGLILAGMLGGSIVVEQLFGLSGVGSLLVGAINRNDYPVAVAVLLLMVAFYIAATTLSDIAQKCVDPRARGV